MSHVVSQITYFKMHYYFVCCNQSLSSVEAGDKTWEVHVEWGDYKTKCVCVTFKVRLKICCVQRLI